MWIASRLLAVLLRNLCACASWFATTRMSVPFTLVYLNDHTLLQVFAEPMVEMIVVCICFSIVRSKYVGQNLSIIGHKLAVLARFIIAATSCLWLLAKCAMIEGQIPISASGAAGPASGLQTCTGQATSEKMPADTPTVEESVNKEEDDKDDDDDNDDDADDDDDEGDDEEDDDKEGDDKEDDIAQACQTESSSSVPGALPASKGKGKAAKGVAAKGGKGPPLPQPKGGGRGAGPGAGLVGGHANSNTGAPPQPAGGKGPPLPPPKGGGRGAPPQPAGGKGPPLPQPKGGGRGAPPQPAGGKGPPLPTPKGGGRGAGAGRQTVLDSPSAPMKPLWWNKFSGTKPYTVWATKVNDQPGRLPHDELERRFSANASASQPQHQERTAQKSKDKVKLLFTGVKDAGMVAARKASLKDAPPPEETVEALGKLDEVTITVELLSTIEANCPDDNQVLKLKELDEDNPEAPFGPVEKYMLAFSRMPFCKERATCWKFVRSYEDRLAHLQQTLEDFETVISCFFCSTQLPLLLRIVLDVGNFLNSGTQRGQADGFHLNTLEKLEGVKDADDKSLRSFIVESFFREFPKEAGDLVDELSACFCNVKRRLLNVDGAEKLDKTVRVVLEDIAVLVDELRQELASHLETIEKVLNDVGSDDMFRLKMPGWFVKVKEDIDELVDFKDKVKGDYDELLTWLGSKELKSEDLCLLFDNFFIPAELLTNAKELLSRAPDKRWVVEDFMVLWGLQEPSASKPTSSAQGSRGTRRRKSI